MSPDFLVIGSGIAGLSFAIRAAEHGSVLLITKGKALDSNTAWAQGGIASVLAESLRDAGDSCDLHVADTLDAGAGLCDEDAVRIIVEEGAATIDELITSGVEFDRENGDRFELGREGGHSKRRILHCHDTTGRMIAEGLLARARNTPNIELLEHHHAIDLITTGKLGMVTEDRVLGAYVLNPESGDVQVIRSDRVILATGGCGKVYLYTTNPDSSTGDGLAMAWRAGATIANMEFVQFHPTCFYNPAAVGPEARSFLVSEAVRGEGGQLVNHLGEDFTRLYDQRGSLAPRDIVARAIDLEIKKTGKPCVFLDVTHKPKGYMAERFPYIYQNLLGFGLDCEREPIPVVPAAHYQCGGVVTDTSRARPPSGACSPSGKSAAPACTEPTASPPTHCSKATLIARRAVDEMMRLYPPGKHSPDSPPIPAWEHGDTTPPDELVNIYHNWDELRRLMWDYVSIVRTDNRLRRAATRLRNLRKEVREFYWGHRLNPDILELRNLVTTASLIVDCAIRRKESRGIHYTLDYPDSDERYLTNTIVRRF
jgi:L-aspartate oxidase